MNLRLTYYALLMVAISSTELRAQETPPAELDRIQLGVVLSPRTANAMGTESSALARAVESALSARGMGSALPELGTRFVAYVDMVPIQEEQAPGGMVAVKEQLTITFGDVETGRSIGMYQTEKTAVGKNKAGALRNFSTSLRLAQNREFTTALDEANTGIIRFFEAQCASLLREADALVKTREFEGAIYMMASVPREASNCHKQAMKFAADAYTAMLKHQCAAPFAQAKAKWAASKSRENAAVVAEMLGTIPADSPCFGEASTLVNDVARVIAQHDAAAAQAHRDKVAWQKKVYEDRLALTKYKMKGEFTLAAQTVESARQVGVEHARAIAKAKPAPINQTIVFR
jgi:hypothetical protein